VPLQLHSPDLEFLFLVGISPSVLSRPYLNYRKSGKLQFIYVLQWLLQQPQLMDQMRWEWKN